MTNTNQTGNPQVQRTYKSRMFEMIFSNKKELLELYNAMHGTCYEDPELLEINTLENAIYMSMHNDISFLINLRLSLYEHQSTYSPNLPLRYLMYIADLYSAYTKDINLYGTRAAKLPTPNFVIFYNGEKELPDTMELKLSDIFTVQEGEPSLELKARLINVNRGRNQGLMEACRTLRDYAEYTARVREYVKKEPLEAAVERAITECIREGILADFLMKNRAEAKSVSIYEYDEERHMRQTWEEGAEEGKKEGLKEGEIKATIEISQEFGVSEDKMVSKLMEKFGISLPEVQEYLKKYRK